MMQNETLINDTQYIYTLKRLYNSEYFKLTELA